MRIVQLCPSLLLNEQLSREEPDPVYFSIQRTERAKQRCEVSLNNSRPKYHRKDEKIEHTGPEDYCWSIFARTDDAPSSRGLSEKLLPKNSRVQLASPTSLIATLGEISSVVCTLGRRKIGVTDSVPWRWQAVEEDSKWRNHLNSGTTPEC